MLALRKGNVVELTKEQSLSDYHYSQGDRLLVLRGGKKLLLLDVINDRQLECLDRSFKLIDPKIENKIEHGYNQIIFKRFGKKNSSGFDFKVFVDNKEVGILENLGWGTDSEFYAKNPSADRVVSNLLKKMKGCLPSGSKDDKIDFLREYLATEKKYFCFYSLADFFKNFKNKHC